MEKMLDKKSRDFAKNMRDTMVYDDMANEVQVGTDLYVDGNFTANSIIENMQGYSILNNTLLSNQYISVVKTGNKITFVIAGTLTPTQEMIDNGGEWLTVFNVPNDILSKIKVIETFGGDIVRVGTVPSFSNQDLYVTAKYRCEKLSNGLKFTYLTSGTGLVANTPYVINIEVTFLLNDNMAK